MWFIDQLNPGNVAYLIPGAFKVSGELDREKFSQALMQVVQRHHILRTHIVTKNGEGWQEVYDGDCWQPQWLDLSDDNNQQQTIEQLIKKNSNTALNLEQDTLFNITLVKLSDTETLLLSCMHHIVSDGWSFGILLQELAYYYGLKSHQLDHELPPLPVQYGDYSLWQRNWIQGDVLESHIDFWRQHLQGAPATLNLPFDRPRPKVQNFEGANYEFSIDAQLSEQLKSCAVENQLTLFMLLLGAYKIQLSRYSGQSDICVGLPVAGRDHAPTEQLIGLFLNAIVLRTRFEGNASLEEYYQGIKTSLLGCLAHQDLPAEILLEQLNIERNLSHAPVAQVGFQLQNFAEVGALPAFEGLALEAMPMGRVSSKYDMTFIMREGEDGLGGVVEYSTALFDQSSIELFVAHFKTLLSNIVVSLQQGVDDVALVTSTQLSEEFSQSPSSQNPNPVEVVSLTHMQRDLVFLSQVTPDTLDNCFGGALIFPSPVDADLLYQALANIAARSSILRSRIGLTDKSWLNNAYRTVWSDMQADWRIRTDIEFKDAQYTDDYIRNFIFRPYDLSNNLMRFELLQQKQQSTLIVGVHHALLDGMGVASMVATLLETYHGLLEQKDFELPDEYFPVYLAKERSNTDTPKAIRYWRDKLSHTAGLSQWRANPPAENSNALLATQARVMTRRTVVLEDDHWLAVKKYCRAQRITPALYFKGLFGLLIELYCRPEEDFSIFELSADLLGMKLNAAGCTVQRRPFIFELETLRSSQRLDDYFKALREEQRVVNKSGLHTSIMMQNVLVPESRLNFMYNYYHFTRNFEVAGHNYDTHLFHNDVEQIHLVVNFNAGQLGLGLHFPEGAFEDLQFVERLESISQQIIAGGKTSAAETMADLAFTLADEKSIIQQRLSGETKAIELLPRVSNEFERSQGEHADRIAVKAGESQLLYSELNQRANCLAARLLAQGVDASSRVAVCLARSPELMIALVAVMKTGASYVPIDSAYPRDRIAYIIEDSGAALLLTSASLESRLPETTVPYLTVEDNSSSSPDLQLPSVWPIPTALDDIFYIIYTSGSTGQPKGAAVKQQGVSNLLDWYRNEFTFDAGDAHLVISAFGFDLTQKNLWLPLLTGACIYFPEDAHYHPGNLLTQIAEQKITTINCAPSAFYGIVDACEGDFQALSSLRWVILGGEAILLDRLRPWLSAEQCNAKLVNNYGPTECTDIAAFYRLEDLNRSTVPIGGPNTNVNLHLVNDAGQPVPQGVVGELCISGAGVGAGYLNKPELTEQVFQRLPEQGDHYWYRSGDLMCLLPDGDLEFVGRKDFQIKLRGMRIELQEVEAALLAQQGVEDCLVLIDHRLASESDQNAEDLERLVAYVIGPDGLNETNWLRTLGERLPQYMIPSTVAVLDQWPLTPNGKVDRKALPKLEAIESTPFMAPRNDIEETLAQIWCEVLGLPRVGVWDNFFQIGGNSLIAVRIMARMEKSFDSKFSLSMLFTAQNIAELSQLVSRHVDPESWSPLVLIKEAQLVDGDDALAPLYLIHPVGGTILCYHALAEALQKHQPKRAIYGLQCSGLEADQAVLNRFELMAAYYLEAIQVIQPEGPYYLAGQSLGGNIAWEMAQQLSAQNKTVALVGLIDSFVPQKIPAKFRQQNSLSMLREQMGASLDLDWQALEAMDLEAQIETFFHAAQAKGLMSAEVGLAQVQRIAHVMKGNGEALLDYEAQACDVSVVHVRASENQNGDSSLGWGELTTGDLVSHTLVASHDGILQGKSATELSALFKGPLKRDL
ncbi:MAG: hypothetical protein COB04_14545 [Gammaproteobacteria bacterium]|nr:MAG: hypothetical protein COB04_14545 [Gammaproteobacteria bacterium]